MAIRVFGRSFFDFSTIEVNRPPNNISIDNSSFEENNTDIVHVGDLGSNDPNAQDTHVYSLVDGEGSENNASFNIDGTQLFFIESANYEEKSSYSIRIKADDGRSGTFEKIFVIDVLGVNEVPSIDNATFAIDENSAISTSVGTVTASDPENDDLTFSIVSGNDLGTFQIDQNSGELTVADTEPLDFETNPAFGLEVEVSDGELADTTTITVNLNDVDDAVLGTLDDEGNSIKLYPNPASGFLNIEWNNFERATISELSGKELYKSDLRTLDLRPLNAGIYLITLTGTNNEGITFRIIKE